VVGEVSLDLLQYFRAKLLEQLIEQGDRFLGFRMNGVEVEQGLKVVQFSHVSALRDCGNFGYKALLVPAYNCFPPSKFN
jgi:hypothetical protein